MKRIQSITVAALMTLGATAAVPHGASAYGPDWKAQQQKGDKKQWDGKKSWDEKKAWEHKGKVDHQKWEDKSQWKQEKPAWKDDGQWKDKSHKEVPKADYDKQKGDHDPTQVDPNCPGWTDGCTRWIGFPEKH